MGPSVGRTGAWVVTPRPGHLAVSRTPAAHPCKNAFPFACLTFFTFVLFLAPQTIFPSLDPLRLGKLTAGLTVAAYVLNRLLTGRALTVATSEVRLVSWFTLLAVISIPLSRSPGGSLEFFFTWFVKAVIIFFLIANLLETMDRLDLLIGLMVVSGFIFAATALYNFAIGYTLPHDPGRIYGYPSGLALNPDGLGLTLNVILALALGLSLATPRRLVKALLVAGSMLIVGGVIVTLSRGAFIALAVTLGVFLMKMVRARGPMVLAPAAVLALLGMAVAPAGYADRLYSLFDWNLDRVGSIDKRWQEVTVASTALLENPLIGAGLGMDSLVFVDEGLGDGWETHNMLLQVGVDLGLPGLLVYVLLAVQILRGLRQTQRWLGPVPEARRLVAIATGVEVAVYGYLAGAFFLPVPYDYIFYYLAGLAVAIRMIGARLTASALPRR